MSTIVIVDYGMGNLRSVSKALETLGASVRISTDPKDVAGAAKLILPGVGAFPAAMAELSARGLVAPIKAAITSGTPYLGICLGLQLLFDTSDEGGGAAGFGLLRGRVRRFPVNGAASLKIPHMGWNQVQRHGDCRLLAGIPEGSYFYFVHSYYAEPADRRIVALDTDYGGRFTSMVQQRNVYATQFHPEKSQAVGLQLLKNFIAL
jgi:glutamine amidotransferase